MINKIISNLNSHYNSLKNNEIFTGMIENITQYKNITIMIESNVDSIQNGVEIYFGSNCNNMTKTHTFTFSHKKDKIFNINCKNKLFYIVYKNGQTHTKCFNMEVSYTGSHDNTEMVLHNIFKKHVSINNSSSKLLGINESFEGIVDNVENYRSIIIIINSDVCGKLNIYNGQIDDNLMHADTFDYNANGQQIITLNCYNFFFKIKYDNTGLCQSIFNISVVYEPSFYIEPTKKDRTNNSLIHNDLIYNDLIHNDLIYNNLIPTLNTINDNITETNNIQSHIANDISIIKNTNTNTELQSINNIIELKNICNEIIHTNNIFKHKMEEIKIIIENINNYDTNKIDIRVQNISHKLDLLNNITDDKLTDICNQKNLLNDINHNIIKNNDKLTHIITSLSSTYEEKINSNIILSDIHIEQKEIIKSIDNLINVNNDLLNVYKKLTDRLDD